MCFPENSLVRHHLRRALEQFTPEKQVLWKEQTTDPPSTLNSVFHESWGTSSKCFYQDELAGENSAYEP